MSKKIKKQDDEGIEGAAILGIASLLGGLFLWLRSRRAQEAPATMQFRQRSVTRSPAKQVSQQWQPESYHWRGG